MNAPNASGAFGASYGMGQAVTNLFKSRHLRCSHRVYVCAIRHDHLSQASWNTNRRRADEFMDLTFLLQEHITTTSLRAPIDRDHTGP